MPNAIEPATTARAKCRGCGQRIDAGVLRFGESLPNPFAEGETTHWFHLDCAAFKRPEPFLQTLEAATAAVDGAEVLAAEARRGIAHPRLPRVNGAEHDPSGRAQCRSCRQSIAKGAWRIPLVFYEEDRFSPAGFVHTFCARSYFETDDVLARLRRFSPGLTDADLTEIGAELQRSPEAPGPPEGG
jgi:poly(ADP-ribose) polymerase-like protein